MQHPEHQQNRRAWNRLTELHAAHPDSGIALLRAGGSTLRSIERRLLGNLQGARLLHLMCQFGVDSLSLARAGASVTGVDISDESIQLARSLASELALPVEFLQSDLLALDEQLEAQYELVYAGYGICHWISDLPNLMPQIASRLAAGGRWILIDDHPARIMLSDPPRSYFGGASERYRNVPDFFDRSVMISDEIVQWQHPLSRVMQAVINAGLQIREIDEYGFGYYRVADDWHQGHDRYWYPPDAQQRIPILWSLVAQKPE